MTEDSIVFAAESEAAAVQVHDVWRILIVDDEEQVHVVTRLVLQGFTFEGKGIELISAFSAAEARQILAQTEDIALVLLDVVMERDDAGLQLVRYIRETLGNKMIRIILRTGQPGAAPEANVIVDYDINDYREK
ncbi:MAG: response regulator, partial [Selenomonadaceae bacterium]